VSEQVDDSLGFVLAQPLRRCLQVGLEGLVLWAISAVFETQYPGIVILAVGLTIGVLTMMPFV
jgi:hypothetical protein